MKSKLPFSEFKILSQFEAEHLVKSEPNKWNVVSIWSQHWDWQSGGLWSRRKPDMLNAKNLSQHFFHDEEHAFKDDPGTVLVDEDHILEILKFTRSHKGEPLLIHCHAGESRSTAIGILVVMDALEKISMTPAQDALDIVKDTVPYMSPNKRVLEIGFKVLANEK